MTDDVSKLRARGRLMAFSAALAAALSWSPPAHAYIDPGSGSMFIQLLVAALAGGLWTLKVYWRRLKGFFSAGRRPEDDGSDGPARRD